MDRRLSALFWYYPTKREKYRGSVFTSGHDCRRVGLPRPVRRLHAPAVRFWGRKKNRMGHVAVDADL